MILKREQADCAIELYERITKWNYGGNKAMPNYKRELAEELYQKCKKLNKTGKIDNGDIEIKLFIKKKNRTWQEYEGNPGTD